MLMFLWLSCSVIVSKLTLVWVGLMKLLYILRLGVFFGQCSEICGVGHANMLMVLKPLF